jgi:hypothetical protein
MFNNNSNDKTNANTDIDQVAKDIDDNASHIGIGSNPSTFTPVMPTQAQGTPPPNDDLTTDDSSSVSVPELPQTPATTSVPAELNDIKDQALKQLSPLVGKLEQNPEEKFKTLMMLIQASDNHDLIKEAYESANKIEDETIKAQALLSIVNEINYFTQQHSS